MAGIAEIRAQYPQYGDLSDGQLADALYSKFYSDLPRDQFNQKIGFTAAAPATIGDVEQAQAPPRPDDVVQRGALLPIGVTAAGDTVAAMPEMLHGPISTIKKILAGTPASEISGKEVFDLGMLLGPAAGVPRAGAATAAEAARNIGARIEPPLTDAPVKITVRPGNQEPPLTEAAPAEATAAPSSAPEVRPPRGRIAQLGDEAAVIEAETAESPASIAAGREVDAITRQQAQDETAKALGPDRAGNINLDRIYGDEDVKAAISQTAADNADFLAARRGVVSQQDTADTARLLGMSVEDLANRKTGTAFNAEQMFAARELLVSQANKVRDLARRAEGGSDAEKASFAEAVARLATIQQHVSGATAEAGRTLAQFRMLAGATKEDVARIVAMAKNSGVEDMARKINALDDPVQAAQFVANAVRAKKTDMVFEAWINALLSGPITHSANIISNALVAAYSIPENATAATISKFTGSGIAGREAFSRVFGMIEGAMDGIRAGWRAYRTENPTDLTSKLETRQQRAIPSANVLGAEIGGKQIRIPGRLLTAEDEFFKSISYRAEINALAMRQGLSENLSAKALSERVAELRNNPTEAMTTAARTAAEKQTFTNPLGDAGQALQTFVQKTPGLRYIIPFIRTPINIVKYAAERSPFAPLFKGVREDLAGTHGAIARDNVLARITLGTTISTIAAYKAADGTITGGGPTDPAKRALLFSSGWQPYSVKLGDTYYSYGRGEPLGTLLGVAADMVEINHAMSTDEKSNLAALIVGSVSRNLVSKTWLKNPADLMEAIQDPVRYGPRYVQRSLGTLVPTALAQIAQANDPYMREARTILDNIKSRIPGEREKLFMRRDAFGNPIKREGGLGPDILSPIYQSVAKNDSTIAEMLRLNITPGRLDRNVRGAKLTDAEYDHYSKVAGQTMKSALDSLVGLPQWRELPEAAQAGAMNDIIRKSRDVARTDVILANPDIALRIASETMKRKRVSQEQP